MDVTTTTTEHAYVTRAGQPTLARVYRSTSPPTRAPPWWSTSTAGPGRRGDRSMGEHYDRALAERGFVVVAIDFRQAPRFQHPAGSADVTRAVRWIRGPRTTSAPIGPRIGLAGSSSGGHLALLAACRPDESEHLQPDPDPDPTPASDATPSASVSCVAALWPPVDPLARYRFALDQLDSGRPSSGSGTRRWLQARWAISGPSRL